MALDDEDSKENPLDHKLVKKLLPALLEEVAALEAKKAEPDAAVKAEKSKDEEDDESSDESRPVRRGSKSQEARAERDEEAVEGSAGQRDGSTDRGAGGTDRGSSPRPGAGPAARRPAHRRQCLRRAHRAEVVTAWSTWWDKYQTPLSTIEASRDEVTAKLRGFLKGWVCVNHRMRGQAPP